MFIRTPYNYDMHAVSRQTGLACDPAEDLTQQQFKVECDINEIVRRFGLGQKMPESLRVPQYGDFTGISDYHEACNAIASAGESFDALPAKVRERFANDPGKFVGFVLEEKNRDEAVRLGIIKAAKEPLKVASVDAVSQAVKAAGEAIAPPEGG